MNRLAADALGSGRWHYSNGDKGSEKEYTDATVCGSQDTLLRFYDVFPAGDPEGFAQIIAQEDEGVVVIGTDPAQWTEGREQWIAARQAVVRGMEGLRFEAGDEPHDYEEGSMGWVADRPRAVLPDGNAISTRLTGVVRQEEGEWRLVHIHISVSVPDEEVVELQRRWAG